MLEMNIKYNSHNYVLFNLIPILPPPGESEDTL